MVEDHKVEKNRAIQVNSSAQEIVRLARRFGRPSEKNETGWIFTVSRLEAYRDGFPNARLNRSKTGVLEVALHTDGGTVVFNGYTHEQFVDLFHAIASDPDNRVVILTGSGAAFMESISPEGFDFFTPQGYDKVHREGKKVLMKILDIEVRLIAAVNGPVRLHSEYILLSDIVLATPSTVFRDKPHFEFGIVPGDGVHLLWPEVIGTVRGRRALALPTSRGPNEQDAETRVQRRCDRKNAQRHHQRQVRHRARARESDGQRPSSRDYG